MPTAPPRRTRLATIRLTPGELAILRGHARTAGVPLATYLRQQAVAHRIRFRRSRFHESDLAQLARIGVELNRFAHAANSAGRLVGVEGLGEILAEVRAATRALRAKLLA